jgi:hypothetical protein
MERQGPPEQQHQYMGMIIEILQKTSPIGISFGTSNEDSHNDCWKDLEKWKLLDRQEIKERVGPLPKEKLPTIFYISNLIKTICIN